MTDPGANLGVPAHWPIGPDGLPIRDAARVALLDPADRLLLMRYDGGPNGTHWATPGGGLDPGEDHRTAARRELSEETGWSDIGLGEEIHRGSRRLYGADGRRYYQRERIYLARTSEPRRQITGVGAMHESDGIAAWRWWPLDELVSTTEEIWPEGLAELIARALATGRPSASPA